jgi:hypothetical protein
MKKNSAFKLQASEVERIREMVPTVDELRIIDLMRDYRSIRKNYFGNSIPPTEEILIRFLPRNEMGRLSGSKDRDTDGYCSCGKHHGTPVPQTLSLVDDLDVNQTRITLLHEMAHMKVNTKFGRAMKHGKNFKKELRRLMAAGAFDDWL